MPIKRTIITLVSLLAMFATLVSCTADQSEYEHSYRCYFTFNTMYHNTSVLKACVNPFSSGQWATVRKEELNGVRHIYVSLYGSKEEDNRITTAEETRQSCMLGANNGLVIGCSTLNNGELYAFDLCCPKCLDESIYKMMTWDKSGQNVKCPRCGRSYNLNNGGFEDTGKEGKLMRYHAYFNGTVLTVTN